MVGSLANLSANIGKISGLKVAKVTDSVDSPHLAYALNAPLKDTSAANDMFAQLQSLPKNVAADVKGIVF